MAHTQPSSRSRVRLATFVGAFLAAALAIASQASSEIVQAKNVPSRTKGTRPEAKAASVKVGRPVNNPFPSLHRELMSLEEGQKSLQRQFESVMGATHRRTGDLERQIDTLNGQLSRLVLQQQELTTTQQLLTVTIRSMRLLLMIISGLLIVLCAALFFSVYQVKQLGGFRSRERKQISPAPSEAPDRAYEPQWKVGS
jgi:hypothetical protein